LYFIYIIAGPETGEITQLVSSTWCRNTKQPQNNNRKQNSGTGKQFAHIQWSFVCFA